MNILWIIRSTVSLGRFGSFSSEALLGHPYGLSYEIRNGSLHVIPAQTLQELGMLVLALGKQS